MVVRRNTVIHTPEEIVRIRRAAQLTAGVRDEVARLAVPGMTTRELDDLAGSLIAADSDAVVRNTARNMAIRKIFMKISPCFVLKIA